MRTRTAVSIVATLLLAASAAAGVRASARAPLYTAADAIRMAVTQRLGGDANVTILSIDIKGDAPAFRDARPDPAARLGKPMRFTLMGAEGGQLPVTVSLSVVMSHAVVRTAIARGHVVAATDVEAVHGELIGTPITRVPAAADIVGTKALRPLAPGVVILPSFVALRRTVEAGDNVTVVALAGAIEVTATFVAADGGNIGDTIRVTNPDTRKFVRGRIVKAGVVEVMYER